MKTRFLGVTLLIYLLTVVVPASAVTVNYTYDQLNRLVRVQYDSDLVMTYSYDLAGNITNVTISGGVSPTVIYVSKDCGSLTPCYVTIQAALNAAEDGDIIQVTTGTYKEAPTRSATGTVTISGGWNTSFKGKSGTTEMYAPKATSGGGVKVEPNVKVIPPQ